MDKIEILDAIENFGKSLVEYARIAKEDLNSAEDTDLKKISDQVIKPALGIKFKSQYLEAQKQNNQWERIVNNFTVSDESNEWAKNVLNNAFPKKES